MTQARADNNGLRGYGFILAGGSARRMGGADKGTLLLEGRRLVDRVFSRLAAQIDNIAICGRNDFDTGLPVVGDRDAGPGGPAAGLYAAQRWMRAQARESAGFFTVPVDGPFLPDDLIARLAAAGGPAIAADDKSDHPTFAFWTVEALERAWKTLAAEESISLRRLAEVCGAKRVMWDDPHAFFNVNSPDDLKTAAAILRDRPALR